MKVATQNMTVPKQRFTEFDGDWVKRKLGDVTKIERGRFSPRPRNNPIYYGGRIPFVQTSDVVHSNGRIDSFSQTLNEKGLKVSKEFKKGTILITIAANIGYAGVLEKNMACPDSLIGISCNENTYNRFLNYLFEIEQPKMDYLAVAAAQKNINIDFLTPYKFFFPTLSEQKKIASFLSAVDERIQKLERKKSLLEEYKKGVMQKIFSQELRFKDDNGNNYPEWEMKKITSLAKTSIGLVTSMTKHYVKLGTPLIRNSDIVQNKIKKENLIYLDKDFDESNKGRRLYYKDIVTVHTGEIGVSAVIDNELNGCQGFATLNTRIYNQEIISSEYLCWYYNSTYNIKYAISMATGDGRSNYNLKDFNKAFIPVPHKYEQQKIASFLSGIDKKIELVETQIQQSKSFKKGLLQQMFV